MEHEHVERTEDAEFASAAESAEGSPAADASPAEPPPLTDRDKPALLVALLFTAGERIESDRLRSFLAVEDAELTLLAEEAAAQLRPLGLDILPVAGGLKLVSASHLGDWIAAFHREVRKARLSKSALEVLAVVAYEQPVSRAQIEEVRQVNSESMVRTLLERRLIAVAGRAETPGRPFLYKTTPQFLEIFGLASLGDLPPRPADLRAASDDAADLGPLSVAEAGVEQEAETLSE